jgi:phosphosulfolactate phosphohydrolase-like enzyme
MVEKSVWGKHLIEMGNKEDIIFCSQQGIFQIVPILKDNSIIVNN